MFFINENIANLTPYVPGKPIKEVEREIGIKNPIKVASNENPWGMSKLAKKAMKEAVEYVNLYPDGNSYYLREKLASFNNVKIENVIVGNGSNEILTLLMRIFLNENTNLVTGEYAFPIYKIVAKTLGSEVKLTKTKKLIYDVDAIIKACDKKTSMIIIDNPNNPTGTYISYEECLKILKFAKENKIICIFDEAYLEYVRAKDYKTMRSVFEEYDNLVITRTFSKAYGLCGLRIGYGLCHNWLADLYNKVRDPFNVNLIAQETAIAAIEDQKFVKEVIKKTHDAIDFLEGKLREMGYTTIDSQGNFLLVKVNTLSKEFFNKLLYQGIIVRPMVAPGLESYIRLSVGTEEQNKKIIEVFKKALNA